MIIGANHNIAEEFLRFICGHWQQPRRIARDVFPMDRARARTRVSPFESNQTKSNKRVHVYVYICIYTRLHAHARLCVPAISLLGQSSLRVQHKRRIKKEYALESAASKLTFASPPSPKTPRSIKLCTHCLFTWFPGYVDKKSSHQTCRVYFY